MLVVALACTVLGTFLGPVRYTANGGMPWSDKIPVTFEFWEANPLSRHWFLGIEIRTDDTNSTVTAYTHISQPWLIGDYLFLKPLDWFGISFRRGQAWLCLPQFALLVALVAFHVRRVGSLGIAPFDPRQQVRLAATSLAVAVVFTLPAFWVPFFRFNPESYFLLPALAFCHLAAVDRDGAPGSGHALATLVPLALFAPLFAPFAVLSWIVLWEVPQTDSTRPPCWRRTGWIAASGVLGMFIFLLPEICARMASIPPVGSSFFYRSGLDGSQRYFTSMVQAVMAPSYADGRPWHLIHWPVVAALWVMLAAIVRSGGAGRMLQQLFISFVPYLWMVIVFPQMTSIHPYLLDAHVGLAVSFAFAVWVQDPAHRSWADQPALRLAVPMGLAALLMTNLLDLARLGAFAVP